MILQQNNVQTKQNNDDSYLYHSLQEENQTIRETLSDLNSIMREQLSTVFQSTKGIEKQFSTLKDKEKWTYLQEDLAKTFETLSQYESLQSRLQSHTFPVNIVELCEKVANTFKATAHHRHIPFSYENNLTNTAPFTHYLCDGRKMQDALIRLLNNAFDTTDKSENSFIHFTLENTENNSCVICIEHNGSSLSKTDLENLSTGVISKEFFQNYSGILRCKELMDSYHGMFTISSLEENTQFTLEFPCKKCA